MLPEVLNIMEETRPQLRAENKTKLCSGPVSPVHIFNVWTIIIHLT